MYGFLKIPNSASLSEKREYGKYMCALCDSLHENYGMKGRLFTNYDSTTLALLIGALDESFSSDIAEAPKYLCLRVLKHKKVPESFKFSAAISTMAIYAKFLDKAIERNKKISKWVIKSSILADEYLSKYGLGKPFFEDKLQEQHRLEGESRDIESLSRPTSEGMSKVFYAIGKLIDKPRYSVILGELGSEFGKLIYIYDAVIDYQNDLKSGVFNCINACYFNKYPKDLQQVSEEIYNLIEDTKINISLALNKINFKNSKKALLIRKILLQDPKIKLGASRKEESNTAGKIKPSFTIRREKRLTKGVIYAKSS